MTNDPTKQVLVPESVAKFASWAISWFAVYEESMPKVEAVDKMKEFDVSVPTDRLTHRKLSYDVVKFCESYKEYHE